MRPLLTSLLLAVAACGGSGSGDDTGVDAPGSATGRYEPWTVGSMWSYKLTDSANASNIQTGQLTTLTGPVDVGGSHAGTMAVIAHIDQLVGTKDVYEAISGDLDVRYRTDFYDDAHTLTSTEYYAPFRLKLDEGAAHTVTGAQWAVDFTQTTYAGGTGTPTSKTKTDQWRVVAAAESTTVPAGTFMALHIQRSSSGGSVQDYWYARGVGKLKETGAGQIEELESYTIAP